MSEHTPTPWVARGLGGDSIVLAKDHQWHREYPTREGFYPIAVPRHYEDKDGFGRTDVSGGFSHADAQHIVACVNFFHGHPIPTENIPEGGFWEMVDCIQTAGNLGQVGARALLTKLGVEGG